MGQLVKMHGKGARAVQLQAELERGGGLAPPVLALSPREHRANRMQARFACTLCLVLLPLTGRSKTLTGPIENPQVRPHSGALQAEQAEDVGPRLQRHASALASPHRAWGACIHARWLSTLPLHRQLVLQLLPSCRYSSAPWTSAGVALRARGRCRTDRLPACMPCFIPEPWWLKNTDSSPHTAAGHLPAALAHLLTAGRWAGLGRPSQGGRASPAGLFGGSVESGGTESSATALVARNRDLVLAVR